MWTVELRHFRRCCSASIRRTAHRPQNPAVSRGCLTRKAGFARLGLRPHKGRSAVMRRAASARDHSKGVAIVCRLDCFGGQIGGFSGPTLNIGAAPDQQSDSSYSEERAGPEIQSEDLRRRADLRQLVLQTATDLGRVRTCLCPHHRRLRSRLRSVHRAGRRPQHHRRYHRGS